MLLVDSTTITVGKTRLLWAPYHGERAGVKLHTALNLSTKLPQKVLETTGLQHDSPILNELVDTACIIVADRAYFQIDRSDTFFEEKQHFVIRVKTNLEMSRKKSLKRMREDNSNVSMIILVEWEQNKNAPSIDIEPLNLRIMKENSFAWLPIYIMFLQKW